MRVLLQKVKEASVSVDDEVTGAIQKGLLLFVGVTHGDTKIASRRLAEKIVHLRIFADAQGKMNQSLLDIGGEILSVSQFTLYGDCRKGRRPNFMKAAPPDVARWRYEEFNEQLRSFHVPVATGRFGAMMKVSLINDGPVTLLLDSQDWE